MLGKKHGLEKIHGLEVYALFKGDDKENLCFVKIKKKENVS